MTYVAYANSVFQFVFDRPEAWSVEEPDDAYPYIVSARGPKGENGLYTRIALQIYRGGVVEGPPERQFSNIDDFTSDWILGLRANRVEDTVEIETEVAGLRASRLSYSGMLPRELAPGAPPFTLRRDVVIFQKGSDVYVLDYLAEETLYFEYVGALHRALDTFRFTY